MLEDLPVKERSGNTHFLNGFFICWAVVPYLLIPQVLLVFSKPNTTLSVLNIASNFNHMSFSQNIFVIMVCVQIFYKEFDKIARNIISCYELLFALFGHFISLLCA